MNSQLVNWTNSWLLSPGCSSCPSNDRLWVLITLVTILGSDLDKKDLRNVHNYFTYLLRGCNPVTGEVKRSNFDNDPATEEPIFTDHLDDSFDRLLNFEDRSRIPKWDILNAFIKSSSDFQSKTLTNTVSEQRNLLGLSLTLCSEKIILPKDPETVRSCLNLYYRHLRYSTTNSMTTEFCAEVPMAYVSCLNSIISRLFTLGDAKTSEIFSQISYSVWFANLVRVKRMLIAGGDTREWTTEFVESILEREVARLKEFLNNYPLLVNMDKSKTRLLDLFGVKTKKKVK